MNTYYKIKEIFLTISWFLQLFNYFILKNKICEVILSINCVKYLFQFVEKRVEKEKNNTKLSFENSLNWPKRNLTSGSSG